MPNARLTLCLRPNSSSDNPKTRQRNQGMPIIIGKLDSTVKPLNVPGSVKVTIERAQK
jgi:hypothetical protein